MAACCAGKGPGAMTPYQAGVDTPMWPAVPVAPAMLMLCANKHEVVLLCAVDTTPCGRLLTCRLWEGSSLILNL
jgi:hypothetical protein